MEINLGFGNQKQNADGNPTPTTETNHGKLLIMVAEIKTELEN